MSDHETGPVQWANIQVTTGDVHCVPTGEQHALTVSCPCGPHAEPVVRESDGVTVLLVEHSSFDGREAVEWATAILYPDAET